jgi:hypothetical protein
MWYGDLVNHTLRCPQIKYELQLEEGDARDVIPARALAEEVDVVVVGSHGKGAVKRYVGHLASMVSRIPFLFPHRGISYLVRPRISKRHVAARLHHFCICSS